MIPVESQAVAELMFWTFVGMVIFILVVWFLDWFGTKLLDATFSSPAEQAQREAERIAKQAIKKADRYLFRRRVERSMRSLRFWNF